MGLFYSYDGNHACVAKWIKIRLDTDIFEEERSFSFDPPLKNQPQKGLKDDGL
jgi:hypothetical protein